MSIFTTKPLAREPATYADMAAEGADSAIRATQSNANAAFDRLSDRVSDVRDQAAPIINRISSQAEAAARRSADALRERSAQLRDTAIRASDNTVGYIKDEPVKAILIAAIAGATLMGLLSLLNRSRTRY